MKTQIDSYGEAFEKLEKQNSPIRAFLGTSLWLIFNLVKNCLGVYWFYLYVAPYLRGDNTPIKYTEKNNYSFLNLVF